MQDLGARVRAMQAAFSPYAPMLGFAHDYIETDAAGSLTKSRTVLERLVVELYAAEMGKEPRKPLLAEMLTDNQFTRRIDRRICARMNAVRDMGNLGTHGEPVQACDARRALDDVCEVLCWYRRRQGGGETAGERSGADGAVPVGDLPPQEQADAGAGGVAVAAEKARIELIIDADFDSFTARDQERVLRAVKELLQLAGDLRVISKRRGSVRLTLELTPGQAEQLLGAARAGRLADVGVRDARLIGVEEEEDDSDPGPEAPPREEGGEEGESLPGAWLVDARRRLVGPAAAIVEVSDTLLTSARAGGREDFLADLERMQASAKQVLAMVHQVLDLTNLAGTHGDFARSLRHDLRTPLTHLVGLCEIWLQDADEPSLGGSVDDLKRLHALGQQLLAEIDQVIASAQAAARRRDIIKAVTGLPAAIAAELRATGEVLPRRYEGVAVLHADLRGFAAYCESERPEEAVALLRDLVEAWEDIALRHGLEEVRTTGDTFLAAAGLLRPAEYAVESCVRCGLEMIAACHGPAAGWGVRVGVHVGSVVAGVVGRRQPRFGVWGEPVRMAARVADQVPAGSVALSGAAWQRVAHCARGEACGTAVSRAAGAMEVIRFGQFLP
jgi:class 3 adenylate cyclase